MTVPKFKKFRIEAYKPGKSKIGKVKNIIKLSANESALGVSPGVKRLLNNKNLILTPHIAASTDEAQIIVAEMIANQFCEFFNNKKITNSVT